MILLGCKFCNTTKSILFYKLHNKITISLEYQMQKKKKNLHRRELREAREREVGNEERKKGWWGRGGADNERKGENNVLVFSQIF